MKDYCIETDEWLSEVRKFTVKWNSKKLIKLRQLPACDIKCRVITVKEWIEKVCACVHVYVCVRVCTCTYVYECVCVCVKTSTLSVATRVLVVISKAFIR